MKVLVTDHISDEGLEILRKQGQVDVKLGIKPEDLKAIIGDYDALVVRSQTKVNGDIIRSGKNLKVIARADGVDNIDVDEATRQGILVVNAPASNTIAVAEHVFGLLLAMARHIPEAHTKLDEGVWAKKESMGVELKGKTLGIIGLGRIGKEVAKRAQAFEMKLLAYDPFVSAEHARKLKVKMVPLEQLLKESDFITLHTALTPQTKGLIGTKELALLKPSARVINCARGELIDEQALAAAINDKKIGGAALDVYCEEPATNCVLIKCANVIHTPHIAASTEEAQIAGAVTVAEQIVDVFNGRPAKFPVNVPAAKG